MDKILRSSPDLSRLTSLLEDVSVSLNATKATVRDNCDLSRRLLRCWYLPSDEELPVCLCSSPAHQKMQTLLNKVEQAVNFSKSLREGRSDVPAPWEAEENDCDKPKSSGPERATKVVSRTGLKPAVPRSQTVSRPLAHVNGSNNRKIRASIGSREEPSSQDTNIVSIDCPLHALNSPWSQPALRQVDLSEALDVKGVPPELVTILKSFHRYMNYHQGGRKKSKSAASFLRRVSVLHEDAETTLEPLREYAEFFKSKKNELRPLEHWSVQGSDNYSTGLWHPAASEIFRGSPLILRYRNGESLRMLHSTLQSFQLTELQLQVAEILLNDLIPQLSKISPSNTVLPLYLKTVSALSAMPPFCMPALVRTTRSFQTRSKTN